MEYLGGEKLINFGKCNKNINVVSEMQIPN
jgi:hypothetical protein